MLLRQSVSSVAQQLLCACTTPVVHAVVNCYTPTIILIYDTPSFFALKNEKGFEALGPKGFGYLYYTSNRNLASKPVAKIHLFFE